MRSGDRATKRRPEELPRLENSIKKRLGAVNETKWLNMQNLKPFYLSKLGGRKTKIRNAKRERMHDLTLPSTESKHVIIAGSETGEDPSHERARPD